MRDAWRKSPANPPPTDGDPFLAAWDCRETEGGWVYAAIIFTGTGWVGMTDAASYHEPDYWQPLEKPEP